ncbi:hypothetical protein [Lysobacter sp. CFH 32150]|uniref:hypothetical protein n=1 Tax=Lysobacter sp. CFH 32150 TaxID=2927128 RepID=UPI001FA8130A|nr:hypothetical protein [Lysobacter sp. CFH 32150]MCI4566708.1 hypothetical protein [Lysobacter sp. CFH 32150]
MTRCNGMFLAALLMLAGCGGGGMSLPDEKLARVREAVDEGLIAYEPLCIEAGPFPYRNDREHKGCDRCQALHAAGLLERRVVDGPVENYVEYVLSPLGESAYRVAPDPEFLALLRKRYAQMGQPDRVPDEKQLAKPRMCFGTTRFHSVTDALAPIWFGGSKVFSVKLVYEAKDTSGHLFDPQIATLGLSIPPRPEPGQPALYPARVMTFAEHPAYGDELEMRDDVRYGRWVNEP